MSTDEHNQLNEDNHKENSFQQMIIYRSLFILKKKFELHKNEISTIYKKHCINNDSEESNNKSSLINVDVLLDVMKEIEDMISLAVFPISRPNELFVSDLLMNGDKKYEKELVLHQLCEYVKGNMKKYNQLYIEKRDKALNKEGKGKGKGGEDNENEENKKPITQYDKEGEVKKTNEELVKENESSPLKPNKEKDEAEGKPKPEEQGEEGEGQQKLVIEEANIDKDKIKGTKEDTSCLYIQTLPVIIADFIQLHTDIALIDTNEELSQEVLAIFDKEIITKLEEEAKAAKALLNNSTRMNSEFYDLINQKNTLVKNITLYEGLLLEKKRKGENTIFIQDMLEKLLAQKIIIDHKILTIQKQENAAAKKRNEHLLSNNSSNSLLSNRRNVSSKPHKPLDTSPITNLYTKQERREMALKDIFSFYSNQHGLIGVNFLFESIEIKKNLLDMAEFSKFCSDFNLALTKEKYVELFKKNTANMRNMTYDEFVAILGKIAISLNDSRKKFLNKKIEKIKETISIMEQHQLEREEKENDKSYLDNKNNQQQGETQSNPNPKPKRKEIIDKALFDYNKTHKKHLEELSSLKYEHDRYMKKTYEEITNDFYIYLSLDNETEYRNKLKGYLSLPFHCQDKTYKLPNKILNRKGRETSNIMIALAKKKSELEKISKAEELLKKDQMYRMKKEQMMIKNKILEKNIEVKMKENYFDLMKNKTKKGEIEEIIIMKKKKEIEKKNNVSWNRLGEMDSEYLELAEIEKNKEIFLETDNSDEMDLLNNLKIDHVDEDKQSILAQKKIKLQLEKEAEKKRKEEMMLKEEEEKNKGEVNGNNKDKDKENNSNSNNMNSLLDQGFIKEDRGKLLSKKTDKQIGKSSINNHLSNESILANVKSKPEVVMAMKKNKNTASAPVIPKLKQITNLVKKNNDIKGDIKQKPNQSNMQVGKEDLNEGSNMDKLTLPPIVGSGFSYSKLNKSNSDHIINTKTVNNNSINVNTSNNLKSKGSYNNNINSNSNVHSNSNNNNTNDPNVKKTQIKKEKSINVINKDIPSFNDKPLKKSINQKRN